MANKTIKLKRTDTERASLDNAVLLSDGEPIFFNRENYLSIGPIGGGQANNLPVIKARPAELVSREVFVDSSDSELLVREDGTPINAKTEAGNVSYADSNVDDTLDTALSNITTLLNWKDEEESNPYVGGSGIEVLNKTISQKYYLVSVNASDWTLDSGTTYKVVKSCSGIKEEDHPIVTLYATTNNNLEAKLLAFSKIFYAVATTDSVTIYASGQPATDIQLQIKG